MKYTVITGASRGIGRAAALEFAKHNKNLFLVSKSNASMLGETKELCLSANPDINVQTITCDISDYQYIQGLDKALSLFCKDGIECLINNAGIEYFGLLQDMSVKDWNNIISTNLNSVFYMCKIIIPKMLTARTGKIINISSVWGNTGASCEVAYSATKGGINSFTKALAKELAPSGISVNAVAPGLVDTDMNKRLSKEDLNQIIEEIPSGRITKPEDIGKIIYNIYDMPLDITGQIITADGGWT